MGILRISGPRAQDAARALAGDRLPPPRYAALRTFRDPETGEVLDRGLLLLFPGPRSYTGEDMVEIHHHGGPAVQAGLLEALGRLPGLRPAAPGEFTRRALMNGRMDLVQAEAVADLVDAVTAAQRRLALRLAGGELSRRLAAWRERLVALLAGVEAELDFAAEEGDVPEGLIAHARAEAAGLAAEIARLLADGRRGEVLMQGLTVAVTGAPNVGKSSLVNRLARRDVAIVTPIPGTTRDVIEVRLDLAGLPVTLLDTAGLRESDDPVEREGIRRARERAAAADLELRVVDATDPGPPPPVDGRTLVVVNKIDLAPPPAWEIPFVAVSCASGAGLDALEEDLCRRALGTVGSGEVAPIAHARQREALAEALAALERVHGGPGDPVLVAEDLRIAARAVGRVSGAVDVEDVLERIFARFCIGK